MIPPGTRLGGYEVIGPIGSGGMGDVYRARDARLNRDVAVKVLPASMAGDPERLRRFTVEAQAVGALNHPNVLTVFEVGTEDGQPFLATELLEGETIREKLQSGRLPFTKAIDYARQTAAGLAAAHARHVVHRDIKPENLFVTSDGRVKILDFGLAKRTAADADNHETRLDTSTSAGLVLGTVGYMSPEQVRGQPVDHRSDLFSLGVVLYEMVSGRRPFAGNSAVETMNAILTEDVPEPIAAERAVPPALGQLIRHCLEKQPDERFQSARDLAFALQTAAGATSSAQQAAVPPPPARLRARRRLGLAVAIGGAVVAGIGAWIGAWIGAPLAVDRSADRRLPIGLTMTTPDHARLSVALPTPDLTLTPDGRGIIYESRRVDPDGARVAATQLVLRRLDTFEVTPLANLGFNPHTPFVSPDGGWVGFETTVGARVAPVLAKAPLAGGAMVELLDLADYGPLRGASWTADGIVFATSQRARGLLHIPAAGGTPRQITTPSKADGERDHLWPAALPDGRGTLFAIAREDGSLDVAVLPSNDTSWRVLVKGGTAPRYVPSGHLVFVREATLYGVGFDLSSFSVTTEPVALVDGILTKGPGAADFATAADGTLAFVVGTRTAARYRMVWRDRNGTVSALPTEPAEYRRPRLSPDGQRIAVAIAGRPASSVWVYDIGRDSFTRVTPRDVSATDPIWSPKGDRFAFWDEGQRGIFVMSADGSGEPFPLARADAGAFYPSSWSPDGRTIAFVRESPRLSLAGVDTAAPHDVRALAEGAGAQVEASFSPDGRWIAHVAFDGTLPEIVVGPAATASRRWPIAPRGRHPVWNPNGREVLYIESNAVYSIAIDPATGLPIGRITKVIDVPASTQGGPPQVSGDGRRFLMLDRVDEDAAAPEIRVILHWLEDVRARIPPVARPPMP
jgi:serine/threonine-protein kinase